MNRTIKNIAKDHRKRTIKSIHKNTPELNEITHKISSISLNSKSLTNHAYNFSLLKSLIENAVALDCEMVKVKSEFVLAHVVLVDFYGNELYNSYVLPDTGINSITDYKTEYSGITREILSRLDKRLHSFTQVRRRVINIIKNKIIIGHGLVNDFKVLKIKPKAEQMWDTAEIDVYKQPHPYDPTRLQPRKLKALAKEFADNNIQQNTAKGHNPLEDARASMNLYRLAFGYPKIIYENMSK